MSQSNGQITAEVADRIAEQPSKRIALDPDELCGQDFKRARVMLGGRDPWEVLNDPEEREDRYTLLIWCFESRTQPDFTWEQAEAVPYSRYAPPEPKDPPQTRPLEQSGRSESSPSGNNSKPTLRKPASARSSSSSTD